MLRRSLAHVVAEPSRPTTTAAAAAATTTTTTSALRFMRVSPAESQVLGRSNGHDAGNIPDAIVDVPDADCQARRPVFRQEVKPKRAAWSFLSTLYKWGYNSMTLFHQANETSGSWTDANDTTVVSTWSQIGVHGPGGMWSGVWPMSTGVAEFNVRPSKLFGAAFGRRDKSGALHIDYDERGPTAKEEPKKLILPHSVEHSLHQRLKAPPLPGFSDNVPPIHVKRVLREVQYHIGNGIRYYLVDGIFGNDPATATPYRILTDNPTHAYFATISALRKSAFVAPDEVALAKRANNSPYDEWAWRRPGVVIYHAPSFDFEAPRIVEEFGGPRPSDLSLSSPKFTVLDPYGIPMKAMVGGQPACEDLLKTTAFLCARWGFYADGKKLLTLHGDSILSADGTSLTVVVNAGGDNAPLRRSPHLYSAHHLRIGGGRVSRCWDSVSLPSEGTTTHSHDLVEDSLKRLQRPLPTIIGNSKALSHRLLGGHRREVGGTKGKHIYDTSSSSSKEAVTAAAASAGLLFGKKGSKASSAQSRPASIPLDKTTFIVVGSAGSVGADSAAKAIVSSLSKNDWLYAEADKLEEALAATLKGAKSVIGVPNVGALSKLVSSGGQ